MGFTGSQNYIKEAFGVESDPSTNVKANDTDFQTNVPKVFATGDARRGQSLVVTAISEGIQAAISVNEFLRK
jgi:glutamate synthase (NADPH/NADH) small chain